MDLIRHCPKSRGDWGLNGGVHGESTVDSWLEMCLRIGTGLWMILLSVFRSSASVGAGQKGVEGSKDSKYSLEQNDQSPASDDVGKT